MEPSSGLHPLIPLFATTTTTATAAVPVNTSHHIRPGVAINTTITQQSKTSPPHAAVILEAGKPNTVRDAPSDTGADIDSEDPAGEEWLAAILPRLEATIQLPTLDYQNGWEEMRRLIHNYHKSHSHSTKNALYSIMCDLKTEFALPKAEKLDSARHRWEHHVEENRKQQAKLENLLIREGVLQAQSGVVRGNPMWSKFQEPIVDFSNPSERDRVLSLKEGYDSGLAECRDACRELTSRLEDTLHQHNFLRPVSQGDINAAVEVLRQRFSCLQGELKLRVCQMALATRSQAAETRRKRRNFPKTTTTYLNEYFFTHLDEVYPSEEVKRQLAAQCHMTIYQVSNWFGNKRVRYKKGGRKAQREAELYGVVFGNSVGGNGIKLEEEVGAMDSADEEGEGVVGTN